MSKSIGNNSIYNTCYKLMEVLFPFIISTYSAHIIFPQGVGKVALVQNITTYFVTVAALGIPNYGIKKIGSVQNDPKERDKVFTELFIINLISTLVCVAAFFAMISIFPYFRGNNLYLVFSSLIILNIGKIDWLYSGLEEYKFIAIRSIAVKTLCLIALPFFVRKDTDILPYAIILCVAIVGNYVLNLISFPRFTKFTFKGLIFKRHLKFIFILLASVCATEIYTLLDSTMVGSICGETDLGYYSYAIYSVRVAHAMVIASCAVMLPRLSLYWKENRTDDFNMLATKGMKLVLVLSIPAFLGLEALSDRVVPLLFGEPFMPSSLTLRILAVLVIVFSVAYIGGHVILIASNREKYTMYAAFAGAVSNFVLNLILINLIGYNGAAIASVTAETIVTTVLLVSARKQVKYNFNAWFFISTILSSAIMFFVVYVLKSVIQHRLVSVIVCTVFGIAVYFGLQLLFKNDTVLLIKDRVLKRFGRVHK